MNINLVWHLGRYSPDKFFKVDFSITVSVSLRHQFLHLLLTQLLL